MRPTEEAAKFFNQATGQAFSAMTFSEKDNRAAYYQAQALNSIANGLTAMTTGLRATYMLLEEVKKLIEQQNIHRAGR